MLSVIVPVWNERLRIADGLQELVSRVAMHSGELIVVDGGSDDGSVEVARRMHGLRWFSSPRGRGRQMNYGAEQARGSLLVFHPVDTRLSGGAFAELASIDAAGNPECGGFHQRFDRDRWSLRLISVLHNQRARLTGIFYGDQLPFVRRELVQRIGGFRAQIDMEDVEFGSRLRRVSRPVIRQFVAVTSSRRFDAAGDLRATIDAARLLAGWTFLRRVQSSRIFFEPVRERPADQPSEIDSP